MRFSYKEIYRDCIYGAGDRMRRVRDITDYNECVDRGVAETRDDLVHWKDIMRGRRGVCTAVSFAGWVRDCSKDYQYKPRCSWSFLEALKRPGVWSRPISWRGTGKYVAQYRNSPYLHIHLRLRQPSERTLRLEVSEMREQWEMVDCETILKEMAATEACAMWDGEKVRVYASRDKITKVISGFPGAGKSYFATHCGSNLVVQDSDSSQFSWIRPGERHPDFPQNYIQHIKDLLGTADIIFVSSHKEVRAALVEAGVPFMLVYPKRNAKAEFLARYRG